MANKNCGYPDCSCHFSYQEKEGREHCPMKSDLQGVGPVNLSQADIEMQELDNYYSGIEEQNIKEFKHTLCFNDHGEELV